MKNLVKHKLLLLVVIPMLFTGCDSLFSLGDTEKTYDGPDVVAFKPLEAEVDEGSSTEIEVQFISSKGLATSDISVSFSVDGSSTASAAHYSIASNSVTIPAGSASASFTINFPADSGLDAGDEVTLILNLEGGNGVEPSANLSTSTIYIQGVDDTP